MIFQLDTESIQFPHPSLAEQDGLLAVGGDLKVERLLLAYENGIFPWYDQDSPILWYAPLERFVLFPDQLRVSKSLAQVLRSKKFQVTENHCFDEVIRQCANAIRKEQDGTWILPEMQEAYGNLHRAGYAHSVEIWDGPQLVGGLYGVQIGQVFCGESMFSITSNASKVALVHLARKGSLQLIDCQIPSDHLKAMGAQTISQQAYLNRLQTGLCLTDKTHDRF
ncbi:MAG: leucyl/phenylalanyl-tRNA--protein transferase [Sphingobacterium sp.]